MTLQERLQILINKELEKKYFSGISLLLGDSKKIIFQLAYGKASFSPQSKKITKDAIFDLASLTKPLATSLAIFLLIERKKLTLNSKLANFFQEFKEFPKDKITILHLLNHTSGLVDWAALYQQKNSQKAFQHLLQMPLANPVGEKVVYSCLGFILLAKIIEKICGDFCLFCQREFYKPLELKNTFFNPTINHSQIVSCYKEDMTEYKAVSQDDNARFFQGKSGNSGLFSNTKDIYRLATTLLKSRKTIVNDFLKKESIAKMWQLATKDKTPAWALGWVIFQGLQEYCHCSKNMEIGTVGHLGYTGTSLMIEPQRERIYIILANRIGSKKNAILMKNLRQKIHKILVDHCY